MRVPLALALLTLALSGCSSATDSFPGPYRVSVVIDKAATRGTFEGDVTLLHEGSTLTTKHFSGSASGADVVVLNETVPTGNVRIELDTTYHYESAGGGSQTNVNNGYATAVMVSGSGCGTEARLVIHVENSQTHWTSFCVGPTRADA